MMRNGREVRNFTLTESIEEATDIVTLRFAPTEGAVFTFIPGQFVTIYFSDDRCGGQGKPYSISSTPSDDFLDITVKKIGRFSEALHSLKPGEIVSMSIPQGYFYPDNLSGNPLVFLAGGIGVTPFYSIIKDMLEKNAENDLILFYSNKMKTDAAFLQELRALKDRHKNLTVVFAFTRQDNAISEGLETKRIDSDMLKKYLGTLDGKQYFICGSIGFVRDLWKGLKQNGVPEDHLQVESFY